MKSITETEFYETLESFIQDCDDSEKEVDFGTERDKAKYYLDIFAEKLFPRFEQEKKRIEELEEEIAILKSRINAHNF
jgi:hypothetical protein